MAGAGDEVGGLVLQRLRRVVAERIVRGRDDPGERTERIAAALEEDPATRPVLADAADTRRRRDPYGIGAEERSPRRDRIARCWEVHLAADALVLSRGLVLDGTDRVLLPGFGPATWRAIGILRAGRAGAEGAWARAVAGVALANLGPATPPGLAARAMDMRLQAPAERVHMLEGARQDLRHALLMSDAAIGVAVDRGNTAGADVLRAECAEREAQIAQVDLMIVEAWGAGGEAAIRYAPAA